MSPPVLPPTPPVPAPTPTWVVMGRVTGVFGVRGWIKLSSDTVPRDNLLQYSPWYLTRGGERRCVRALEGHLHRHTLIVRLEDCVDREQAQALVGCQVTVSRAQLPALPADEFYWADLEGLHVQTLEGVALGQVQQVFATGANDVLVVQGDRERLIPYIWEQVIKRVDLAAGQLVVDWDADF